MPKRRFARQILFQKINQNSRNVSELSDLKIITFLLFGNTTQDFETNKFY